MMVRFLAYLFAVALLLCVSPAADAEVTSAGQVRYQSLLDAPYAVNARLRLHPGFLYIGTADTVGAYAGLDVEPSRSFGVFGGVFVPYKNLTGEDMARSFLAAEAGIRFHFVDALRQTRVRMTLASSYTQNYAPNSDVAGWTNETYVDAPATSREVRGIRLGAQYLRLPLNRKHGDWEATRVGGFIGYYYASHTNRRIRFTGYGVRSSQVQMAYFLDVSVAHVLTTEAGPGSALASAPELPVVGVGGRLGVEMSSGLPAGLALRGEVGWNPGSGGMYGTLSVGMDLNLAVGGGLRPPK